MKQPKDGGRLLADVGEDRKQNLYKILFGKQLTYKGWLIKTIDGYIRRNSEIVEKKTKAKQKEGIFSNLFNKRK